MNEMDTCYANTHTDRCTPYPFLLSEKQYAGVYGKASLQGKAIEQGGSTSAPGANSRSKS